MSLLSSIYLHISHWFCLSCKFRRTLTNVITVIQNSLVYTEDLDFVFAPFFICIITVFLENGTSFYLLHMRAKAFFSLILLEICKIFFCFDIQSYGGWEIFFFLFYFSAPGVCFCRFLSMLRASKAWSRVPKISVIIGSWETQTGRERSKRRQFGR